MGDRAKPYPTPMSTLKKKRKIIPKILSFSFYKIVKKTYNLRIETSFLKNKR